MAVFSVNQNRQFYVATKFVDATTGVKNKGEITVKSIGDIDKEVYFQVMGPDTVLRSDRIPVKNISYVKAVKAADMVTPLKSVQVSLNTNVNSGKVVVGQDYVLRINFRQFYGMSDEDQYFKDVAVRATKDMVTTPKNFYDAVVKALNLSFSREVGATKDDNPYLTFTSATTGITITEKPQPWHLGTEEQLPVIFEIVPTTIYVDGVDEIWGTVEDKTPKKSEAVVGTTGLGNGKKIADLEYFCLGERGDQYRKIGFPNDIETVGMVDPTKEYDILEIHYAFTDEGVNSYRSEKDITIAVPKESASAWTEMNKIIGAFNTAAGLSVPVLATAEAASSGTGGKD